MKIVLLLVIYATYWTQNAEAKEITPIKHSIENLLLNHIKSTEIANLNANKLLSISDLWDKIKTSVTNAWNAIKEIANKTKEKINIWIQDLKKRAEEIKKAFEAKLKILKDKLNEFIQAVLNTAGDVKLCIEQDRDAIQELLKQIAIHVATCIGNSIKTASVLDSYQSRLVLDDDEFVKGAEEKIYKCVEKGDDAEDCLNKVRGEIYDDMEHTENSIMETRHTSRNLAEDALETILQCAADGIIEASAAITEEVLKIINCVIDEKPKSIQ